jgi:hypothetical protein
VTLLGSQYDLVVRLSIVDARLEQTSPTPNVFLSKTKPTSLVCLITRTSCSTRKAYRASSPLSRRRVPQHLP